MKTQTTCVYLYIFNFATLMQATQFMQPIKDPNNFFKDKACSYGKEISAYYTTPLKFARGMSNASTIKSLPFFLRKKFLPTTGLALLLFVGIIGKLEQKDPLLAH